MEKTTNLEWCLSEVLRNASLALNSEITELPFRLNSDTKKGVMWLNSWNARDRGQDAFYVEFTPSREERCECSRFNVIAEGRFFSKKLFIRWPESDKECPFDYVRTKFVPFLKLFFERLSFKVVMKEKDLD